MTRELEQLVNRFHGCIDTHCSPDYDETRLRREYLDPFFEILGWDVYIKAERSVADGDVVQYAAATTRRGAKAPDYCFRVGGAPKFFVLVQKPFVRLQDASLPAHQLRRYAWSAGLPISILTNFKELAIYNCTTRPRHDDKADTSRHIYTTYDNYASRWGQISSFFARQEVVKGSLTRFAEANKLSGVAEDVTDALFDEISGWRTSLAKNISTLYPYLDVYMLNLVVQRTIDRILFLRFCEDYGIERYGSLLQLTESKDICEQLYEIFKRASAKYGSDLFGPRQEEGCTPGSNDNETPRLRFDDGVICDVLQQLYYPVCPYEFGVLPSDILGGVYERFLGKVICVSSCHEITVEDRQEFRKNEGVYYTPSVVVDYVVMTALSPMTRVMVPEQLATMRVLDPACGSGAFLLGAYRHLLHRHLEYYTNTDPEKWTKGKTPVLYRTPNNEWNITFDKRKEILTNCVFGVDIDAEAVEVTKRSLLLKVLERKNEESNGNSSDPFQELTLPDLATNIKCGNSLIGPDYYRREASPAQTDTSKPVNAFDWKHQFPAIMANGGFDAVIGNPPYLSFGGRHAVEIPRRVRNYLTSTYQSVGWPAAHSLFIERAITYLSRRYVSFVVPDHVGHLDRYQSIRNVVTDNATLREVRYWGEHVFNNAISPVLTFVAEKLSRDSSASTQTRIINVDQSVGEIRTARGDKWIYSAFSRLLDKLRSKSISIRPFLKANGIKTTNASAQIVDLALADGQFVAALEGKRIGRYYCGTPMIAVKLDTGYRVTVADVSRYLSIPFLIRQTAAYPIVAPREHTPYYRNSLNALCHPDNGMDVRYVAGLLNSKLIRFAYAATVGRSSYRVFPQVNLGPLGDLPIMSIDFSVPVERAKHDEIVDCVTAIIATKRKALSCKNALLCKRHEQTAREIDDRLDNCVYSLYRLTSTEIATVEEVVKGLDPPP